MKAAIALLLWSVASVPVLAQDQPSASSDKQAGDNASMAELIGSGYKIVAAVPNGKSFIVFLQKDTTAYACEFASLSTSRCGVIN